MAPEPTESTPVATYPDRLTRLAEQAGVSGRGRHPDHPRSRPGVLHRPLGRLARAADLPGGARHRRAVAAGPDPGAARLGRHAGGVDWTSRSAPGPTARTPTGALAELLPADARVLAVDYHMPAVHALNAQAIVPGSELTLAGEAIAELRMRKGADEVAALAAAGRGHRPGAAPDRRVADGRAGPRTRSPPTSPPPSSTRAMHGRTSSSSGPARTAPARTTRPPTG